MKDIDKELDKQLREQIDANMDGQFKSAVLAVANGDTTSMDFYVDIAKKNMLKLITTQVNQARIDELKRWEAPENEIMMTFADPCNICGFNYKTLRQAQQDRLKELKEE